MAVHRCYQCGATFTSSRRLQRHVRTHMRFGCRYCSQRFNSVSERDRHLTSHRVTTGTMTSHSNNYGCRLLTPTRTREEIRQEAIRRANEVANYRESEASRTARRSLEDPLNLLGTDSEDEETPARRDW